MNARITKQSQLRTIFDGAGHARDPFAGEWFSLADRSCTHRLWRHRLSNGTVEDISTERRVLIALAAQQDSLSTVGWKLEREEGEHADAYTYRMGEKSYGSVIIIYSCGEYFSFV
jgi:hypothetical protein